MRKVPLRRLQGQSRQLMPVREDTQYHEMLETIFACASRQAGMQTR